MSEIIHFNKLKMAKYMFVNIQDSLNCNTVNRDFVAARNYNNNLPIPLTTFKQEQFYIWHERSLNRLFILIFGFPLETLHKVGSLP